MRLILAILSTHLLTYKAYALLDLIDATARNQTRGFGYETIHIGLTAFPMMNGHISHIANVAERCERGVQEQCKQRTMMLYIS